MELSKSIIINLHSQIPFFINDFALAVAWRGKEQVREIYPFPLSGRKASGREETKAFVVLGSYGP